ncbi:zinc finger, CCHC-type containing protein [Tanacetum coccineum]
MNSQDVTFYKEEINDEMDSIMGNNTWVFPDLPPGCKPLGCKWIFKRKLKVDGTVEKFKARLVIQGFKQKSRIDYFDTYAPVLRISTIRLLIAMASIHNQSDYSSDGCKDNFLEWFSMKDMGEADVILGIRIKHESNGIAISQSHYIKKALKKFNYFDCTSFSTPMDTSEKLMPNNGQAAPNQEVGIPLIGCLMYAMTCTRPDIAFVVGKLSRYTSNPGTQHWQAIQRVLKYLKKPMVYRLTYIGYPSVLEGYTDASWISNTEENSSTSGWVFLLGGGAISWALKKQTCITGSTMKSEFVALAAAGKEAEWVEFIPGNGAEVHSSVSNYGLKDIHQSGSFSLQSHLMAILMGRITINNGVTFEKGYYLADGIYPQWAAFVKSFTVARDERNAIFKRCQESAQKDV